MRLAIVVIVLLASCNAATKKQTFDNKVKKILTTYLGNNLPKATTLVIDKLVEQKTFEEIVDVLMSNVMSLVPATKYISSLAMLTSFDSCVKKTGGNMEEGMALLGTAFKKVINAPYTQANGMGGLQIINKMKTMKKNKKPIDNMRNQAYTLATSAMTKPLIQKIIDQCKKVVTKEQYACALGPLNTVMLTNLYQMDYAKTG